jgi:hypothetical protein
MSEDRKKKGGSTLSATEDGRKDTKKKKCDHCNVANFTKYDCQTCKGEFFSDCTNLKPADCKHVYAAR